MNKKIFLSSFAKQQISLMKYVLFMDVIYWHSWWAQTGLQMILLHELIRFLNQKKSYRLSTLKTSCRVIECVWEWVCLFTCLLAKYLMPHWADFIQTQTGLDLDLMNLMDFSKHKNATTPTYLQIWKRIRATE